MFLHKIPHYDETEEGKNQVSGNPVRVELYDYCAQHDIAITVMKTFGGGDRLLDAEKSPLKIALTRDQCFAYVLAKPCVKVALCSIDSASKVDEYLHYLKATDEEKDYNSALSKQTAQNDMDKGACTYCNHCAPCPAGIDIAKVNELLDKANQDGKVTDELAAEYKALEHHASECIECGQCEGRCPFSVAIRDKMKEAVKVFGY